MTMNSRRLAKRRCCAAQKLGSFRTHSEKEVTLGALTITGLFALWNKASVSKGKELVTSKLCFDCAALYVFAPRGACLPRRCAPRRRQGTRPAPESASVGSRVFRPGAGVWTFLMFVDVVEGPSSHTSSHTSSFGRLCSAGSVRSARAQTTQQRCDWVQEGYVARFLFGIKLIGGIAEPKRAAIHQGVRQTALSLVKCRITVRSSVCTSCRCRRGRGRCGRPWAWRGRGCGCGRFPRWLR